MAIPGVIEFALSLFFCKFVAYTFIYWLPYYLGHVGFPAETAGYLSIFFDLGGIPGGILAGIISDHLGPSFNASRGIVIFTYFFYSCHEKFSIMIPNRMRFNFLFLFGDP